MDLSGTRQYPLVTMILTTRDRPRLLRVALACYRHQTYANRELIVVDDGNLFPADAREVQDAGGRLIQVEPGTALGAKLNRGIEQARGTLCQKMDDDDWYSPRFVETMIRTLHASQRVVCRPSVAFVSPFLFFDVARWEIRRSADGNAPGATLLFAREDWRHRPFRGLRQDEDVWFYKDQRNAGAEPVYVKDCEIFLAVRHRGSSRDRPHTWTLQLYGQPVEDYLTHQTLHRRPENLLPAWAINVYRELQQEILSAPS